MQLIQKLRKKEELIKSRIEERDRARKIAAEQRAELRKKEGRTKPRKGKRYIF